MNVLVTGSEGFIGRNLVARLRGEDKHDLHLFDIGYSIGEMHEALCRADIVYHLAGVNRPQSAGEFETGNTELTRQMCDILRMAKRAPRIIFASSTQASLDNPYGSSKRRAEEALRFLAGDSDAVVRIYRLTNVFGKWSRPNYNSVVATFCHNIANDLPIAVSDPSREIELAYIDDVVESFLAELGEEAHAVPEIATHRITLSELAGTIQAFREMQTSVCAPDFGVRFNRQLYATYLSCVPEEARRQHLTIKADARGGLAEFIKSPHFGQIFVSRTRPGGTRGDHYHHTKTEKFFVVEGEGVIRMRQIEGSEVSEYRVHGKAFQVIDIPPGYTHSIENVGGGEMVTVFWSSEIFDPDRPDTYFLPVLVPAGFPASVKA